MGEHPSGHRKRAYGVMKLSTARRMQRMKRSTIREILKLTKRPGIISFAGGLPTPELFPIQEFKEALQTAMEKDPVGSLQYDVTEGYRPLKEWICGWLTRQGFRCTPEEMMLTNGSQQALDLLGKIFLDPGDCVLVEDPTYLGAIQAFNAYEPKYTTVPMDDQGILPEDFAAAARKSKPKFAYLVPTFQNPSGVTLNLERRKKILALARKNHLPIIEDDPYGYLRFSGTPVPSMYALSRGKGVIYLSTLSKILSPGIRVGFVLAEPKIINALVLAKQAADLQPNSLIQRAVYHYAQAGHFERHIPKIIMAYGEKLSATALFPKAIKANVAYVTGSVFYANGGGHQALRLNFTNSTKEQIETGIERLGTIFNNHL
jgi:2-aminoadipate transaminase